MKRINIPRSKNISISVLTIGATCSYFVIRKIMDLINAQSGIGSLIFYGIVVIILFLFMFNAAYKLFNNSPALVLDKNGLTDNISMMSAGFIPWNKVAGCLFEKHAGSNHLLIQLKNHQEIKDRLPKMKKKLMEKLETDTEASIAINPKLVNYNMEELLKIINHRKR